MDPKDKKEPVEVLVFKKSIKFDLSQAIDGVINGLAHPLALDSLSLEEREEFTNTVVKIVDQSLDEIKVEIKERARIIIQAYRQQDEGAKNLKKLTGNRPVN